MTTSESFEWALQVAEAELIGEAATREGASPGAAQLIENNVLLHPGMVATLRKFNCDDAQIAWAMLDPDEFADKFCEDLDD
jgi:hypothetical protein